MTHYKSDHFELQISFGKKRILLAQLLHGKEFTTKSFPATYQILEQNLPTIFDHKCFNGKKLPFGMEVRNTEIGHLFEHIILEHLKLDAHKTNTALSFTGETRWDWVNDTEGKFNIYIRRTNVKKDRFTMAVLDSIKILENIFEANKPNLKAGSYPALSAVS